MTQTAAHVPDAHPHHWFNSLQRARLLLSLASLLSLILFYAAAQLINFPHHPGYSVSIFQQHGGHPALDLITILVVLVLTTLAGTAIAGVIRVDGGFFGACVGLLALSARGGNVTATLHAADSPAVYLSLLAETVLLFACLALAWLTLLPLIRRRLLHPDRLRDGVEPRDATLGTKLLATATQVVAMIVLMMLLAQSDDKVQVIGAVAVAAFAAAALAHSAFPVEPSLYFWIGPGVTAVIGYAWAYSSPGPWLVGHPANALAAPLPLDYASVGPASALLGYWMSRRWLRARQSHITPPAAPPMTDAHMPLG